MRERKINDDELLSMIRKGKQGKECAEYFGVSEPAISKRLKRLLPKPKSLESLTEKEQKFCVEVATGNTQTNAALKAYECSSMQSAKVIGSQLMDKPEINMAITELMTEAGLTKRYRLQRLRQHVDHLNPDVSLKALDQSWKLDGSYAPDKHLNMNVSYADLVAEEERINLEIEELERKLGINAEVIDVTPEAD